MQVLWPEVGARPCENDDRHCDRLLFAGAVQRMTDERLTHRVMFGTMAGGENPGLG